MKAIRPRTPTANLRRRSKHALIAAMGGLSFWWTFSLMSAVKEPWDGVHYWSAAYPGSLLLSAAFGFVTRRDALVIGLAVTFAQFPMIVLNTGFDTSLAVAAFFLGCLSVPTTLAARVGATLRFPIRPPKKSDAG